MRLDSHMERRSVVTIGVFDGVHRGHLALLETTVALATSEGLRPAVVTFHPHPKAVLRGQELPQLATVARRSRLLQQHGIELVHVCTFDAARASQSAADFIEDVLLNTMQASIVVVGEGFRFGKGAQGNAQTLRDAGLIVHEVAVVAADEERISSTRIRQLLSDGDIASARPLLTRPHRLEGVIVDGNKRGRDIGYPTANLAAADGLLIPADGVYAGWLVRGEIAHGFDGETALPAAISIGTNPTFDDVFERRVEAYVLDRTDLDLYVEYVAFDFHARIRGTVKFDGLDALLDAMANDVEQTRRLLS